MKNKSNFNPPKYRDRHLDEFIESVSNYPLDNINTYSKHNLTYEERKSLNDLQNDKSIIIKEADKGSAVVIMNSENYKQLCLDIIDNDDNYYKLDTNSGEKTTKKKYKEFLEQHADNLTKKELDYLTRFEIKESNFYGLPKVHKCKEIQEKGNDLNKIYIEMKQPDSLKLRPITAGPSSQTHTCRLGNLLDILLKLLTRFIPSYVRYRLSHPPTYKHFSIV